MKPFTHTTRFCWRFTYWFTYSENEQKIWSDVEVGRCDMFLLSNCFYLETCFSSVNLGNRGISFRVQLVKLVCRYKCLYFPPVPSFSKPGEIRKPQLSNRLVPKATLSLHYDYKKKLMTRETAIQTESVIIVEKFLGKDLKLRFCYLDFFLRSQNWYSRI